MNGLQTVDDCDMMNYTTESAIDFKFLRWKSFIWSFFFISNKYILLFYFEVNYYPPFHFATKCKCICFLFIAGMVEDIPIRDLSTKMTGKVGQGKLWHRLEEGQDYIKVIVLGFLLFIFQWFAFCVPSLFKKITSSLEMEIDLEDVLIFCAIVILWFLTSSCLPHSIISILSN